MTTKRYYQENKELVKYRNRVTTLKEYNLTIEQYNKIFADQDGRCAICGIHNSELAHSLSVDHCHETKKVRGLLCICCNTALGKFRDSPDLLNKAIKYLQGGSLG